MRRVFRLWLREMFEIEDNKIGSFLIDVLINESVASIWIDELLIALMSEGQGKLTHLLDNILELQHYQLLIRALQLLHTACNIVDDKLCQQLLSDEETKDYNIYRFTKPSGCGWDYLISYMYYHRENIP